MWQLPLEFPSCPVSMDRSWDMGRMRWDSSRWQGNTNSFPSFPFIPSSMTQRNCSTVISTVLKCSGGTLSRSVTSGFGAQFPPTWMPAQNAMHRQCLLFIVFYSTDAFHINISETWMPSVTDKGLQLLLDWLETDSIYLKRFSSPSVS